jgi:hypothetical protein
MSTLPIREQILQALATRTGASRQLAAYDPRDLPITILVDGEETAAEGLYGMTNVTMPVTFARAIPLTGVKADAWHTAAQKALADLIEEIYTGDDDTLGGLADGIDYAGGQAEILTDGGNGAAVQVSANVRYAFVHGNPYSQDADSTHSDFTEEED